MEGVTKPILFRCGVYLTDGLRQDVSGHKGEVAFHRWFPEGISDALVLDTGYTKAILRVWFERGDVSDDTLAGLGDESLAQAGAEVLTKYGVLWSGPLRGELRVHGGLSSEQIAALEKIEKISNEAISEHYEVAKLVLKYWICPQIAAFVRVLRFCFGQYWVEEFEEWNGDRSSLSYYCNNILHLTVSTDEGLSFRRLSLGEVVIQVPAYFPAKEGFGQYITREDWQGIPNLARVFKEKEKVSVVIRLISRAHELTEVGNVKQALLEAITALEIALHQRVRENLHGSESALASAMQFLGENPGPRGVPIKVQVAVIGALIEDVSVGLIEEVQKAYDLRNDIAHKGNVQVPEDARKLVFAVLNFVLCVLKVDYRFVSQDAGNLVMGKEHWDGNADSRGKTDGEHTE